MIDVKELKTRYDEIAKNIKDRYMNVDLDKIVKDQDERAALLLEVENLRSKRNETAQKMKQKLDNETRQRYIQEGRKRHQRGSCREGGQTGGNRRRV